ncbi:hypothetical protein BS78_03G247000 [Paspalum vaginatum]|nr:hypothetical protein BS78_03G247000 [Paspalum vaginatum]
MAEYQGEYGQPYPRVDQYGNPVPPVDQYGNPVPREPAAASGLGGGTVDTSTGQVSGADAGYPPTHDGVGITAPGGVAYPSGGVAPGETALAYEGMVGSGGGAAAGAGFGGAQAQLQPGPTVVEVEEERTFGSSQLQPSREERTTTLGEKMRGSDSSSSSEDDGQGGRRKKKSIKEKIKEKLPGTHKHEEQRQKAGHAAPAATGTAHEKKGFVEKIKKKLPGHH